MTVSVRKIKMSFYDFVLEKLGNDYERVRNDRTSITLAMMVSGKFRVEVCDSMGEMIGYFQVQRVRGNEKAVVSVFRVGKLYKTPDETTINLTAYDEIPDFIQALFEEYEKYNPDHKIDVVMRE